MPNIEEVRVLLIEKLQELFQLDQPDLDFGFYRIMHMRSKEITDFLENDLLNQVKDALTEYTPVEKQDVQKRLNEAIKQAQTLGADPETLPKVKELREKLAESIDMKQVECDVYDALYHFFSRYYSDGDFISQRVYKEGVYAIPFEGEEVKLHWANADQYYVKTCEYLRDYCFRTPSNRRVHFKLIDATEGEHGNIKASEEKNRVFILAKENFCTEENGELVLRFEYRPATMNDWPKKERSEQKTPPNQDNLIGFADVRVTALSDMATWIDELRKNYVKTDGEEAEYSVLTHHLKRYAARNSFDYFIHKDLGTFLRRELDFFIKNELMFLDDIENETAPRVEQYLSKLRAVRRIAKKIITFLAQLEDFQKKLWLKKKFIVETNYCITLDRVPKEFYEEIAANDAQREEWIKLYCIDEIKSDTGDLINSGTPAYSEPLTVDFLAANPNLVLDTKFFFEEFKQRLLDVIPNFDGQCDGLLIHSENFQALNLLQSRYKDQVKCVYIDPPYNTAASEILYKNNYKHSSWLCMIYNSLLLAKKLINHESGMLCCTIDDVEQKFLSQIIELQFGEITGTVAIRIKPSGRPIPNGFAISHEYAVFAKQNPSLCVSRLEHNEEQLQRYNEKDEKGCFFWEMFRKAGSNSNRVNRPTMFYPFWMNSKTNTLRLPQMDYNPVSQTYDVLDILSSDESEIYPIKDDGSQGRWYFGLDRALTVASEFKAERQANGTYRVYYRRRPNDGVQPTTLWFDSMYSATEHGTALLKSLFGEQETFSYPKSIHAVVDCISVAGVSHTAYSCVLDYFAGSGTTGHAVINLNREDNGHRKYILVEMGEHFDTVLKPRIEKVVYSKDWKDGKPTDRTTGVSHCFKYIRLESYEDTLNNLDFKPNGKLQKELKFNEDQDLREEYMLKYYLEMESQGSPSLLNVEAFFEPTEYRLKIKRPGGDESVYQTIDLLETFNYLIGLKVDRFAKTEHFTVQFKRDQDGKLILDGKIKRTKDGQWWFRTVTGETLDGQKVLIIWRNRPGKDIVKEDSFEMSAKNSTESGMEQDNIVLDAWFEKLGFDSASNEFDIIYVNGTNNLDNLNTSNSKWRVRLIEDEFQTKMWE